jgi:hypothetical protein
MHSARSISFTPSPRSFPAKLIPISAHCRRYQNASLLRLFSLRLPFPNSSMTHQQIPSHEDRSHQCMWKCAKTLHAESNVPFEGKTSHPGPALLFWHVYEGNWTSSPTAIPPMLPINRTPIQLGTRYVPIQIMLAPAAST